MTCAQVDAANRKALENAREPEDDLNWRARVVFSQPVIGYARNTVNNYIAPPLMTFLTFAVPGVLEAAGPEITTLNLTKGTVELTKHALERSIERGITQNEIDRAIESAKETGNVTEQIGKFGTKQLIYKGANGVTVVLETAGRNAGKAISAWR